MALQTPGDSPPVWVMERLIGILIEEYAEISWLALQARLLPVSNAQLPLY